MARIRTVKPEFFASMSEKGSSLGARVLFLGMFTEADDAGRMIDSAKHLAGAVFPFDDNITARKVEGWLRELEQADSIRRYQANGRRFIAITKFGVHQKISHPTPSRLPSPPESFGNDSGNSLEALRDDLGSGSGSGSGSVSESPPTDSSVAPAVVGEVLSRIANREVAAAKQAGTLPRSASGFYKHKLAEVQAQYGKTAVRLATEDPDLSARELEQILTLPAAANGYYARKEAG